MSNKKGFTLIEILVVIVIIGALITLLYPMVINVANRSKKTVLANKIEAIELAAASWAQSFDGDILWTSSNCTVLDIDQFSSSNILVPCEVFTTLTVQNLIDNKFLKADNDEGEIVDPVTDQPLNNHNVTVQKYYGQYYGIYQE